jgi:hypothetical protein
MSTKHKIGQTIFKILRARRGLRRKTITWTGTCAIICKLTLIVNRNQFTRELRRANQDFEILANVIWDEVIPFKKPWIFPIFFLFLEF